MTSIRPLRNPSALEAQQVRDSILQGAPTPTDPTREYWQGQEDSSHRLSDEAFFRAKAREHAALFAEEDRGAECLDLGCGAGELLRYLLDHLRITTGLDYSESMLQQARSRLAGRGIKLTLGDVFVFLPNARHPIWLTAAALNQYLERRRLLSLLDLFVANPQARAFYLFDCADPIRWRLLHHGISYRDSDLRTWPPASVVEWLRAARRFSWRVAFSLQFATGLLSRPCIALPGKHMGYGYLPQFWIRAARERGLQCEIRSSLFYEYRYHVVLRKAPASLDGAARAQAA